MSAHEHRMKDAPRLEPGVVGGLVKGGYIVGGLGLVVSVAALALLKDLRQQFFFSWLTAFAFFATLSLGALFFSVLHHLVRASWSTSVRRIAENMAWNLPLMAVLFIPVLLGIHDLYHWSHAEAVAEDPILQWKSGYLNTPFFVVRAVIFFAVWIGIAWYFRTQSLRQDETGDLAPTFRMRRASPVATLLFALTISFASFDWLMSLDPHWFSTIFGVYVFAGAMMANFAGLALATLWLTGKGQLTNTLTVDNFHDIGKLLFGFIVFWTYIAFSQYFLIWYGNIPEETVWYIVRQSNGWMFMFMLLVFGHFIVPFWVLMSRYMKRNRIMLGGAAAWLLLMHYADIYFLVMPVLHHHLSFHWLDLTTLLGMGGLYVALFARRFTTAAIVPVKDPQLVAAMEYENA